MLRCWCDLMPKCSMWGGPRRPARRRRAPRIAQVAPNSIKILFCNCCARGVSKKPRYGEARGSILDGFWMDSGPSATCNGPHVQRATLRFQRAKLHFRRSGFSTYIEHFRGFSTFKISHFPIKIQSTFHNFSDASFWMSFF